MPTPPPERTPTFTDLDAMPFGKYNGTLLQDVPASYFHYLWTHGMKNDSKASDEAHASVSLKLANYIYNNLHRLKLEYPDGIWS